ncbi:hypothetical protein MXM19_08440 [Aeromonas caviae]|uniref:hypothetical protein n=1 Tax=Aeromonas caviae TaxID=648 RepID=UPI002DB59089|nr:hypothetical protein [Aeromonas caviae]MEB6640874.1 hypothetical protein [Aeromonas caviae]
MKYTHYKNRFSSKSGGVSHLSGSWDEVKKLLLNKSSWVTFHATTKDQYKDAKEKFDGIVFAEMKPNQPRTADNVISFYAIVLDIDNGSTYAEVREDLKEFEYVLYSTGGTGLKSGDNFRVVLPLQYPMSASDWKNYNASLTKRFPYSDECFKKGIQIQYLPVLNTAYKDKFIVEYHSGRHFDHTNINDLPYVENLSLENVVSGILFDDAVFSDSELRELGQAIIDHQFGQLGYEERRLLAQRLKHIGMNDFDAVQVLDRVSQQGFTTPNQTLVSSANPAYAHPEGLYKHLPKGSRIPALERRIVRSVKPSEVSESLVHEPVYTGEWTLQQDIYVQDNDGTWQKIAGEYLSDIADQMVLSDGINLIISDVATGKSHYFANKNLKNFLFVAPLTSIVDSLSDTNSLTDGKVGTWNQIESIIREKDKSKFSNITLVVDECHGLVCDYGYKGKVINQLISCFQYFKSVILMSGTVEPDYFSSIDFDRVYRVRKESYAKKILKTYVCDHVQPVVVDMLNQSTNKAIVLINDKALCETISKDFCVRNSIVIHSDNKHTKDVQEFFKTGSMGEYQVAIGTNSIVEGVSVTDLEEEFDIFIVGDCSPDRIEQFCNRPRSVVKAKNVYHFIQRRGLEQIDSFDREQVIEDTKDLTVLLGNVLDTIKTPELKSSFKKQFSREFSGDFVYFADDKFHVSYTSIDYDYGKNRDSYFRNDFSLFTKKMLAYGFIIHQPIFVTGCVQAGRLIGQVRKVVKEKIEAKRKEELKGLIRDVVAGTLKCDETVSDLYISTYESCLKLVAKGLLVDEIPKAITGFISDEFFFTKAHSDADHVDTGHTIREMIVAEIADRFELTGEEIRSIADKVVLKVLDEYFQGDVDRMCQHRSWSGLVNICATDNTCGTNILIKENLSVVSKSSKAARQILERYILLDKSKSKNKIRVTPILALSQTGLTFKPLKVDIPVTQQPNQAVEALKDQLSMRNKMGVLLDRRI